MVTLTCPEAASLPLSAASPGNARALPDLVALGGETARDLVQLFKLLADETRLKILYYLMQTRELNVRTICRMLAQSQPAVSHHLALLRVAGIIECRRDGKHNFYHLIPGRTAFLDTVFGAPGGQMGKLRIDGPMPVLGSNSQPDA
jgi:ArsR family transcriptional regulator, arsenate/arsenite/antimonite-responsive transcriptional repressor